jgi:putative transcriptional regulator
MAFASLAPCLLLAAPRLGDPNFERKVILLGKHEDEGALGWILDGTPAGRVGEQLASSELVPEGLTLPETPAFARQARQGGPVSTFAGWLLFRRQAVRFQHQLEVGDLVLTSNPEALHAVMRGEGPKDFRLILGCAGWGAGQLEGELKEGSWLPAPLDAELVLKTSPEKLWDEVVKATTGLPAGTFNGRTWGGA